MAKEVFTLNEVYYTNKFLSEFNEWLVEHEGYDDDVTIVGASITLVDKNKRLIGSFTKWSKDTELQFEPGFAPEDIAGHTE